jgi:uncharacterized protein YdaU (DUF1376 family)
MAGLSRFDFYPRDWYLDTRDLSQAAKGVYIDLLGAMYARGDPLPLDERELCRLCGCATVRSLRPLLSELIETGKLKVSDGELTNGRAMEEIAKFQRQSDQGAAGGKTAKRRPRRGANSRSARIRAEFEPNSTGTQPETGPHISQNQSDNIKPPSPSPSPLKKYLPSVGAKTAHSDPLLESHGGVDDRGRDDRMRSAKKASPLFIPTACTGGVAVDATATNPKQALYAFGAQMLGRKSGGLITELLRRHDDDIEAAQYTLTAAAAAGNPRQYLAAILNRDGDPPTDWDIFYDRLGVSL